MATQRPGAEQGTEHIEQQQELDTMEEEAGIPTHLDNPRAPGGTVVKSPKGEPRRPDSTPGKDPAVG